MTNQGQHRNRPTGRQLEFLRILEERTEGTFSWPTTFEEADKQIKALLGEKKTTPADRRRERLQTSRGLAEESGDAAAFREDELAGYGASAAWAGRRG